MCDLIGMINKNPLTVFISVAVLTALAYHFFLKSQENLTNPETETSKHSFGMMILGGCCTLLCGMILPFIIIYFITKSSAKSAIKSVMPDILKSQST